MQVGTLGNFMASASRSGLGAPLVLMLMLAMIILPVPPFGLDVLFTFNIALSLAVMLVTIYTLRPLNFSAFPTVLLIATLLRLALNIASTRVVLLEGHTGSHAAGQVIEAFGAFVIGGNFAVGIVVFSILVIINFVVVTKGAGRVSEVSARFTLDAMPGKQMAVDADLNAGLLTQDEARARRQEITQEADFYGSMDGASKFVRGDAIAGLLILFINIIGGMAIGMAQHGLPFSAAGETYILLSIGDALVAQIPALLLSAATAVIVTRVSNSQDMGQLMTQQMFQDPRALGVTAGILGIVGIVPGMPNLVFLGLSGLAGAAAWKIRKNRIDSTPAPTAQSATTENPENRDLGWDDIKQVDIIGLEVGYKLIPLVDSQQDGSLLGRIKGVRRKLSEELGFLIQPVHIRDNLDLAPTHYRVTVLGVPEGEGEVLADKELAINPGEVYGELRGSPTRDPAFGMDAVWIDPAQREHAQMLGYTVVDAGTVVATHLNKVLREHAHDLLGHEEAQQLLHHLGKTAPKLVESLVPKALPLSTVARVLQNLLREGIPVRDLRTIAEALAEHANTSQDADALTGVVRVALRRMITQQINGLDEELPVVTLGTELEQILLKSLQPQTGHAVVVEPGLAERLTEVLGDQTQRLEMSGHPAVLLVSPALRMGLARLVNRSVPGLRVLAYNEIAENKRIRVLANIGNLLTQGSIEHAA